MFSGLDWFLHPTLVRGSREAIAAIAPQYHPTVVSKLQTDLPEGTVGLVCQGLLCKAPATSQGQLMEQLVQSQVRSS